MTGIFNGLDVNRADGRRVSGVDTMSVRATANLALTDSVTNTLRVAYSSRQGNDINNMHALLPDSFPASGLATYRARFATIGSCDIDLNSVDRRVNEFTDDRLDDTHFSITNQLPWESHSGFAVDLISGHEDWHDRRTGRYILSTQTQSLIQFGKADSDSASQDLLLTWPEDLLAGHLSIVGGLYCSHDKLRIGEAFHFKSDLCNLVPSTNARYASRLAHNDGLVTNAQLHQKTDSIAAYGRPTVHSVPTLETLEPTLGGLVVGQETALLRSAVYHRRRRHSCRHRRPRYGRMTQTKRPLDKLKAVHPDW